MGIFILHKWISTWEIADLEEGNDGKSHFLFLHNCTIDKMVCCPNYTYQDTYNGCKSGLVWNGNPRTISGLERVVFFHIGHFSQLLILQSHHVSDSGHHHQFQLPWATLSNGFGPHLKESIPF